MKKTVTLNPDESKVVAFEVTPIEAGVYNVSVNGLSGSFVASEAPPPPPAMGMISLYMTGPPTQEWSVGWYYADEGIYIKHYKDYRGVPNTPWRAPEDPSTPPKPIDLNDLRITIETYSNFNICPMTGMAGACNWQEFGPFVVEDGGTYVIDVQTRELSRR